MQLSYPNFFIGGATASGTSFLTALLLQHPDIYLPPIDREPHFFSLPQRYAKGIDWYLQTCFPNLNPVCETPHMHLKAIGERSTTYFHFPSAAPLLKKHLPHAKFIFVLREPAERCFAQYRYMVLRGIEELDFEEALTYEEHRLDKDTRHFEYKGRSLYGHQLRHFLSYFAKEQLLILSSEKLRTQTTKQLKRITDFLNLKPLESFETPPLFSSFSVKDRKLQKKARDHFGSAFKYMIEGIRLGTDEDKICAKNSADEDLIAAVRKNLTSAKEEMPEESKKYLFDFFQDDQKLFFSIAVNTIDFTSWS